LDQLRHLLERPGGEEEPLPPVVPAAHTRGARKVKAGDHRSENQFKS
jgi:hypothetical protein